MKIARCFTLEDQRRFAALSGDCNPIHMDPVAARRTQAGAIVVHGIHVLLWALEELSGIEASLAAINRVRCQFAKFMYVGQELVLERHPADDGFTRFLISHHGLTVMTITVGRGELSDRPCDDAGEAIAVQILPADLPFENLAQQQGWLAPIVSSVEYVDYFPKLSGAIGADRVQSIAALSYLVGMVCPGLHSIFAKLDFDILSAPSQRPGIGFSSELDDRFRLVHLRVSGTGIAGSLQAFARHPPVQPPSMNDVSTLVRPDEFAGVRALIVGGSRGLGATTAKIITAGGGSVIITYAHSASDASGVADDIAAHRGDAAVRVLHLDVLDEKWPSLQILGENVNAFYYFATTQIFGQKTELFSSEHFDKFINVYVKAFQLLCKSLSNGSQLNVFYPSSIAVEQRPPGLTEYSMAKAAAEILCHDLSESNENLHIKSVRLPRILTDQTATLTAVESADPVRVMLPIIRDMVAAAPPPA